MIINFSFISVLILFLFASQATLADTDGAVYPKLQNQHNTQQEALQDEQRSYEALLLPPGLSTDRRQLPKDQRRQSIHLRQLQYQQRHQAVTEQQRALSQPDRSLRENSASQLNRSRQQQESERLHFKMQRRSWPYR
jgi:hypothetical protein